MARKKKRGKVLAKNLKVRKQRQIEEKISLKWRLIKAVPLMLLGLLFVVILLRTDTIYKIQTSYLDTLMRVDLPAEESDVVIVEITQEDFETLFEHKTRPLHPQKLYELITAVSRGKPCVIGVDIDTSFSQFNNLKVESDWSPVIWTRSIEELQSDVSIKPKPLDVLGGQAQYNANSGLPLLIADASGITRFYTRAIETEQNTTMVKEPAFFWTIYKRAAQEKCARIEFPDAEEIKARENESDNLFIRYSRGNATKPADNSNPNGEWTETAANGRIKITASQIFKFAESADWQNNSLIKDKIVLIGGTYLGEDMHETPLGRMAGVEIIANVVESELRGGGIRPPNFWTITLLSLFDGLLLIGLFQIFPMRLAFPFSIAALFALSFICSFLTFYSFSYWGLFALVMAGVLAAELLDYARDFLKDTYKRLITEIQGMRSSRK